MNEGNDPLIHPSDDWGREYPAPEGHQHSSRRRRRRRRVSQRARRDHRRVLRTVALCSIVLLAMVAGLYAALSQGEHEGGSAVPAAQGAQA